MGLTIDQMTEIRMTFKWIQMTLDGWTVETSVGGSVDAVKMFSLTAESAGQRCLGDGKLLLRRRSDELRPLSDSRTTADDKSFLRPCSPSVWPPSFPVTPARCCYNSYRQFYLYYIQYYSCCYGKSLVILLSNCSPTATVVVLKSNFSLNYNFSHIMKTSLNYIG